jgi:hypothetical protein
MAPVPRPSVEQFTADGTTPKGGKAKDEKSNTYIYVCLGVFLAILALALYFFVFKVSTADADF